MKFHDASGAAKVAHQVFDTWSGAGTQPMSEGTHAHHLLDSTPDLRGRVLHVEIHQVQRSVPAEVIIEVFSAYGQVEEMFQSPHMQQHTHAPSVFVEYEHGNIADKALHALNGLYLYPNDCQLHIRHANLKELQAFYGYSAPSFSEEQLELLQQIKKDLEALSQNGTFGLVDVCLGTALEATPPTQKTLSADISSVFEIESSYSEENQEGLDIKEHKKQKRHVSTQLQWELESLVLPTIALPDACAENEEANIDTFDQVLQQCPMKQQLPQDSNNTTTVALAKDILVTHDDKGQNDAQLAKAVADESSNLQNTQPCAMIMKKQVEAHSTSYIAEIVVSFPLLHEEEVHTAQTDMLPTADVLHMCQPWPPPIEEVHHQDSRDAPVTMPTVVLNVKGVEEESSNLQIAHFNCKIIHLPCSPLSDWSRWILVSSLALREILSQMQVPQVRGLVPCSSNVHEPSTNISSLCGHIKTNPLMLTWDPGTLHCTHWEVSKPINKGNFSCLQLVLLWVTMNYTVIHPTYLICLCTSLPGEDSGQIHALKLTVHVWSYSVVVIHIPAIQFSDMRQTLEIYEKHLVQNFKLNMARPTIMISRRHEIIPQVGANEHWQTMTWNTEIRAVFLVLLTNGSPNVSLRMPWDPGVQHSQLGSSAQMMLRKLLQASREYQFNIPCTVMLIIKHEVSDCMSNKNKNSICPALLSQGLKATSVGHTRRYDCSNNIYLAILTVRSYFSTNSEMKLLLDISSLKECHTAIYFYILQLSYMNLCCCEHHLLLQPHEHLLKMVTSTYLPKHILTRITKASSLVDVLNFLLCKTISTGWLTSYYTRLTYASQYCPQCLVVWKMIRSHDYSPKYEVRLQCDPGANRAYFLSWLEILSAVEKPMEITQVHTQHQLHSKSSISLWEFSVEKDVQMQCNSAKNCKFNDLTFELYNSWFSILHYCKSFQKCKESQVVGRRKMMPLSFLFHIGNIAPTHYYEVHLVFKADHCQHAKGTHGTGDSAISFHRTLQPYSDTHYMAFTLIGNSATHGLVAIYLNNFSHMLHFQTLGLIPKLRMISFMPP